MSTTLTNGLKLPDKGSVDWYADMQNNYAILDGAVGTIAEHTTALAGKASDSDVVHKTGNETVGGTKTFTKNIKNQSENFEIGVIPSSTIGTGYQIIDKNNVIVANLYYNQYSSGNSELKLNLRTKDSNNNAVSKSVLLNTDQYGTWFNFRPSDNSFISLGSANYRWSAVYSDSYYYGTTAWGLDKDNQWLKNQSFIGERLGTEDSANTNTCLTLCGRYDTVQSSGMIFTRMRSAGSQGSLNDNAASRLGIDVLENGVRTTNALLVNIKGYNSETGLFTRCELYSPLASSRLGTSTNKWKTLNGVNPGALSLPGEYSSSVTEYITDKTGVNNTYTAPADGWVGIQASSATLDSGNFIFMGRTGGTDYYAQNALSPINAYWNNLYHGCILLPVISGKTYGIRCKCDSVDARFYRANGNVS